MWRRWSLTRWQLTDYRHQLLTTNCWQTLPKHDSLSKHPCRCVLCLASLLVNLSSEISFNFRICHVEEIDITEVVRVLENLHQTPLSWCSSFLVSFLKRLTCSSLADYTQGTSGSHCTISRNSPSPWNEPRIPSEVPTKREQDVSAPGDSHTKFLAITLSRRQAVVK